MAVFRTVSLALVSDSDFLPQGWFSHAIVVEASAAVRRGDALQPLPVADGSPFKLLANEILWKAARAAGVAEVPVTIHAGTDLQLRQVSLQEHLRSYDPDRLAAAELMMRLKAQGMRHKEIAALVGLERTDVAHLVRLRKKLSVKTQQWLRDGMLKEGHGRILARLSHDRQETLASDVMNGRWSVRTLEQKMAGGPGEGAAQSADIARLERELSEAVGNPVKIEHQPDGTGAVRVTYNSSDEAEGIFDRLRSPPTRRNEFY